MEIREIIEIPINPNSIHIKRASILELLGHANTSEDDHFNDIVDQCLITSTGVIKPKGGIIFLKNDGVNIPSGEIIIDGKSFLTDKIIASQIKHAEYIALFICTIGDGIETLSKKMTEKGDLLEGYVFDLIGSEAAEETAGIIHESIKKIAAKEQLKITNRFSPGYCNWSVGEQFKIFSFFKDSTFGIKLTDSALMNPIKSVSGIIGVGEKVAFKPYSCSVCSDEKCIYRNRKSHSA